MNVNNSFPRFQNMSSARNTPPTPPDCNTNNANPSTRKILLIISALIFITILSATFGIKQLPNINLPSFNFSFSTPNPLILQTPGDVQPVTIKDVNQIVPETRSEKIR